MSDDLRHCPMCGTTLQAQTVQCLECGEQLKPDCRLLADRPARLIAGFLLIAFTAPVCAVVSAILTGIVAVAGNVSPFGYGLMLICGLASAFGAWNGWLLITMQQSPRQSTSVETTTERQGR